MNITENLKKQCGKEISQCSNQELYEALLALTGKAKKERRKSIMSRQSF